MSIGIPAVTGGDTDQWFGHGLLLENKKTLKALKTFRVQEPWW
jgi:hypothetical protein